MSDERLAMWQRLGHLLAIVVVVGALVALWHLGIFTLQYIFEVR